MRFLSSELMADFYCIVESKEGAFYRLVFWTHDWRFLQKILKMDEVEKENQGGFWGLTGGFMHC